MSVKASQLPITSPCPITLDRSGVSAQAARMFCEHCTKDVHLLSQMSEAEVRELMEREAGNDICVSYAPAADGSIRFRDEPKLVPVSALRRAPRSRPLPPPISAPRRLSLSLALGAGMFLAACTSHGEPEVVGGIEAPAEIAEPVWPEPKEATPCEPQPAGGIRAEPLPPPEQVDGGIRAQPLPDEPEATEPVTTAKPRPKPHRRGGIRARPVDPDELPELL